jgi:hypothetical protein
MVVEGNGVSLRGNSISIEFVMSSWEEARKIFNHIDIESDEWQNIFDGILKAFGTKMKEEDEAKARKQQSKEKRGGLND